MCWLSVKQLPVHGTKGCQQVTSTPVPKTQVLQPAAKNFAPSVAEPVAAKSKDAQKVQKAEKKPCKCINEEIFNLFNVCCLKVLRMFFNLLTLCL